LGGGGATCCMLLGDPLVTHVGVTRSKPSKSPVKKLGCTSVVFKGPAADKRGSANSRSGCWSRWRWCDTHVCIIMGNGRRYYAIPMRPKIGRAKNVSGATEGHHFSCATSRSIRIRCGWHGTTAAQQLNSQVQIHSTERMRISHPPKRVGCVDMRAPLQTAPQSIWVSQRTSCSPAGSW
jgi:hypothetical protein